jgi:hypothetical protein
MKCAEGYVGEESATAVGCVRLRGRLGQRSRQPDTLRRQSWYRLGYRAADLDNSLRS